MNIKAIGSLIRRRRRALKLDQRSLSDITGVAVHSLSNIESGKGNPTVDTLEKVCEPLGLELVVVVRRPGTDEVAQP